MLSLYTITILKWFKSSYKITKLHCIQPTKSIKFELENQTV